MRRTAATLLVVALAATLAGCMVGPDFAPPKPPPVNGYEREGQPAPTAAAADLHGGEAQRFVTSLDIPGQWWTLFHSPALNTLLERALAANPSLEAAQETLRQAQEQLYAGQGALFPTVSAGVSTTREKITAAAFGSTNKVPPFTFNNASLSVSYLLDIWGGERRQIESLAAQAEYQRFELEAAYLTLTSNVVAAAIQEASLRGQVAATEEIVAIETQQLAGLKRQFSVGAANDTAVLAQAATLEQTRAQLPGLQKQLAQTRNALTAYLGRFPSQAPDETFDLAALQLPVAMPLSLPSKLVEQRPDIRASEAQLHAASAQVGVATANMLPQITLSGSYGSETTKTLFTPGSDVFSLGASLTQPLFKGGELLHQRRAAVAAFKAAAAQYRQTVITAFQNVADALRALQADATAVEAEAAAEKAASDSLAASQRQFRVGAISYLSLLNAEQTYQQARLNLVQAEANRFSDTAALFQALGGGWWNRSDVAGRSASAS